MSLLRDRFVRLDGILMRAATYWQPVAFYGSDLSWTKSCPDLRDKLLNLDDSVLDRFESTDSELIAWLAGESPELAELHEILQALWSEVSGTDSSSLNLQSTDSVDSTELSDPAVGGNSLPLSDAWRVVWEIPGRKREQIQAFVSSMQVQPGHYVEWCSGKGHLGRWLLRRHPERVDGVTSVELNPALCVDGQRLADRLAYAQSFVCADALAPSTQTLITDAHVLALHACGDLHRHLVLATTVHRPKSLALSPCCYHLGRSPQLRSLSGLGQLVVDREQLRLAVTDRVTIHGRDLRLRAADMLVRHAYVALREHLGLPYRSFASMPSAWSSLTFAEHLLALCRREAFKPGLDAEQQSKAHLVLELIECASGVELAGFQQQGAMRWARVRRLDLVRLAFRRALEFWCVLDLASLLEQNGYSVQLRAFCDRALTPRNLLLEARI